MARILIACEFSGTVRDAFLRLGHDAWSCDILPAEFDNGRHIQADAREILNDGWDLLIAHPPCTRLCRSGRRWLSGPGDLTPPKQLPRGRTWSEMVEEFEAGVELFTTLWEAPIAHVAIENPVMHDIASRRMPHNLSKPQLVQPFWFGHPEYKQTGLYLRGLPPLKATDMLSEPARNSDEWKRWTKVWRMPPSKNRGHERSRFFKGIADAMAEQWTEHLEVEREAA